MKLSFMKSKNTLKSSTPHKKRRNLLDARAGQFAYPPLRPLLLLLGKASDGVQNLSHQLTAAGRRRARMHRHPKLNPSDGGRHSATADGYDRAYIFSACAWRRISIEKL